MARQVLQRVGDALGLFGGSRPRAATATTIGRDVSVAPGPSSEEAEAAAREGRGGAQRGESSGRPCGCGCRRWESTRTAAGKLAWVCGGCRQVLSAARVTGAIWCGRLLLSRHRRTAKPGGGTIRH